MTFEIAPHVVVDHNTKTVTVGGEEFPWCITEEGPQVRHENGVALISLTFIAETAEVRQEENR